MPKVLITNEPVLYFALMYHFKNLMMKFRSLKIIHVEISHEFIGIYYKTG